MWLAMFMIIAAIICAALTIVSAGAFSIVLVVVAIIAAVAGIFAFIAARQGGLKAALQTDAGASETVTRVGGTSEHVAGREPATPEDLVNARRAAQ